MAIIILAIVVVLIAYAAFRTPARNKASNKGKLPSSSNFAPTKTPFKA